MKVRASRVQVDLVGEAVAGKLIPIRPFGADAAKRQGFNTAIYGCSFNFGHEPRASAAEHPIFLFRHNFLLHFD